jgi:hypothetical protein
LAGKIEVCNSSSVALHGSDFRKENSNGAKTNHPETSGFLYSHRAGGVLVFLAIAFLAYVNDYRHADETALSLLESASSGRKAISQSLRRSRSRYGYGVDLLPRRKVEETAYLRCWSASAKAA